MLRHPTALTLLFLTILVASPAVCAESAALAQIRQDGRTRMGRHLGFEGFSFVQKGKKVGLEVESTLSF